MTKALNKRCSSTVVPGNDAKNLMVYLMRDTRFSMSVLDVQAQAVGKRIFKSNGLEGTWKVSSLLIHTNIAPQSPNQTNDLRLINVHIMDKMRSRSPFSLSFVLILFLHDVGCSPMHDRVTGFPLLLSRIFHHFHVDFSDRAPPNPARGDPAVVTNPPREYAESTSKYGGDDAAPARDAHLPLAALLIECRI
ncbi:hypothetical protein M9H77_02693 [Catharanthus roseus]|uniref:Uncharacterized protein n=1 Tax=Catharanthus roseus TaxID=4058 RepID=A0ACC0C991_CATRO|nr:hypothetical protein M9H77_02693 [Catharanthus roseus]